MIHVRVRRFVLLHGIIFVIFFQLGFLSKYQDDSGCDCVVAGGHDERQKQGDEHITGRNASTAYNTTPFDVSRFSAASFREFLSGRRSVHATLDANKETALVVRYGPKISTAKESVTQHHAPKEEEVLRDCKSLKVFEGQLADDTCLVVAPSEESYHVYHWELDATSGRYRPIGRIQSRDDSLWNEPMKSFYWIQQFTSMHAQVTSDLQNLLQPSGSALLVLVVVNKSTVVQEIPRILSSTCTADKSKILIWCLDLQSCHIVAQHYSFLVSYYNPEWQSAAHEQELPVDRFLLVSEVLAVQQLVLLGYHVLIQRHRIDANDLDTKQKLPRALDWRAIQADVVTFRPPSATGTVTLFSAPMTLIKSNVWTKATWSKLVLSLDLLTDGERVENLLEIVSNYAGLFGMNLVDLSIEQADSNQVWHECTNS